MATDRAWAGRGFHRARVLLAAATLLVVITGLTACGDDADRFTGTWRNDASNMTIAISQTDDGWTVDLVPEASGFFPPETAVMRDGKLYVGRSDVWEFVPVGADLRLNFVAGVDKGAPSILLSRVEP